jgi:hypothetical protein
MMDFDETRCGRSVLNFVEPFRFCCNLVHFKFLYLKGIHELGQDHDSA